MTSKRSAGPDEIGTTERSEGKARARDGERPGTPVSMKSGRLSEARERRGRKTLERPGEERAK